jgi:hypothetical protein
MVRAWCSLWPALWPLKQLHQRKNVSGQGLGQDPDTANPSITALTSHITELIRRRVTVFDTRPAGTRRTLINGGVADGGAGSNGD